MSSRLDVDEQERVWREGGGCAHGPKVMDGPWHAVGDYERAVAEATKYLKEHGGAESVGVVVMFRRKPDA